MKWREQDEASTCSFSPDDHVFKKFNDKLLRKFDEKCLKTSHFILNEIGKKKIFKLHFKKLFDSNLFYKLSVKFYQQIQIYHKKEGKSNM